MIGAISQKKDFSVATDSHYLVFSYQPQHMHIHAVNKETNQEVQGFFYENTLPEEVKQQCQRVHDLYEFLQTKRAGDLQVNELDLMFKVIRIKKQKWYHLSLIKTLDKEDHSSKTQSPRSYKRHASKSPISLQRQYLLEQNKKLRQMISTITKSNQIIQINNPSILKDLSLKNGNKFGIFKEQEGEIYTKIQKLVLTVESKCLGFPKYTILQNTIQKLVQQPAILLFSNKIKRHQHCSFSVKINNQLHNNWIVLGLMSRQHFSRSFCYFMKKSFAFSGTVGIVFAEMQVFNCSVQPGKGDILEVQVINSILRWKINGKLFCLHLIPAQLGQTELFPYLMLAQPGDSITINASKETEVD